MASVIYVKIPRQISGEQNLCYF